MQDLRIYNTYLLHDSKTIIKYRIIEEENKFKLKSVTKETYPSFSKSFQRAIELEENGYKTVSILLLFFSEKEIIELFGEEHSKNILPSKKLKLVY